MTDQLPPTTDCLIVGGGVIGLSLAWELSRRGVECCVIDCRAVGRESSWAGAGMLAPGSWYSQHPALVELARLSFDLNANWSALLHEQTGIDNEFALCGGTYIATSDEQYQRFANLLSAWQAQGIEVLTLGGDDLRAIEPNLSRDAASHVETHTAFHVPQEGQIRNPQHLLALVAACRLNGVSIVKSCPVESVQFNGERVARVVTSMGECSPGTVVLAAGAWSGGVGRLLGASIDVEPVRGQMLLFGPQPEPVLAGNVHIDSTYAVSRRDGRLLVGATVEHAGFDKSTTPEAIERFTTWGRRLSDYLATCPVEKSWAGLRPGSADGLPYMGQSDRHSNLFVSSGHFRAGLQFAAASAQVMAELITGAETSMDLQAFRIDR